MRSFLSIGYVESSQIFENERGLLRVGRSLSCSAFLCFSAYPMAWHGVAPTLVNSLLMTADLMMHGFPNLESLWTFIFEQNIKVDDYLT